MQQELGVCIAFPPSTCALHCPGLGKSDIVTHHNFDKVTGSSVNSAPIRTFDY